MPERTYYNDTLLHEHLDYCLEVRRLNGRTVADKQSTFRGMYRDLQAIKPDTALCDLELKDILRWLQHRRQQGNSPNCLRKSISHLRCYLHYAMHTRRIDRNVLDGFRLKGAGKHPSPNYLSINQARMLVESCCSTTPLERRDRLIILVLYGCGLRTTELCQLNIKDIDIHRQELFIKGKGDKERTVPIPRGVYTELLAYLQTIGRSRGALFCGDTTRSHINGQRVNQIIKHQAALAGITQQVTARTLRHTFATHLMDQGVDLSVISSLMGHSSVSETGVYLHALKGKVDMAVEKLNRKDI